MATSIGNLNLKVSLNAAGFLSGVNSVIAKAKAMGQALQQVADAQKRLGVDKSGGTGAWRSPSGGTRYDIAGLQRVLAQVGAQRTNNPWASFANVPPSVGGTPGASRFTAGIDKLGALGTASAFAGGRMLGGFGRGLFKRNLAEDANAITRIAYGIGTALQKAAQIGWRAFKNLFDKIRVGLLGLTFFGIKQMLFDFVGQSLAQAGRWEQLTTSFRVLAGSAEDGRKALERIQEVSLSTPFTIDTMARSVQAFMASGFNVKQAVPMAEIFGDMAAGMIIPLDQAMERLALALGQIQGKGRVMAEEMRQLANLGIPAWDAIAKKMSQFLGRAVSVKEVMKMVHDGQVDATIGIQALMELSIGKFGGLMEEQGKTWFGLLNQVHEMWGILQRDIGFILMEGMGLKQWLNDLKALIQNVRGNLDAWKPAINNVLAVFSAIKDVSVAAFQATIDKLRGVAEGFGIGEDSATSWYNATVSILKNLTVFFEHFKNLVLEVFAVIADQGEFAAVQISYLTGGSSFTGGRSVWSDLEDIWDATFGGGMKARGLGEMPARGSAGAAIRWAKSNPDATAAWFDTLFRGSASGGSLFAGAGGVLNKVGLSLLGIPANKVEKTAGALGLLGDTIRKVALMPDLGTPGLALANQLALDNQDELVTFRKQIGQFTALRKDVPNVITEELFGKLVGNEFLGLRDKFKSHLTPQLAGAVEMGSKDAYSAIAQFEANLAFGVGDPIKELVRIQAAAKAKQDALVGITQKILDAQKKGNPILALN